MTTETLAYHEGAITITLHTIHENREYAIMAQISSEQLRDTDLTRAQLLSTMVQELDLRLQRRLA